MKYTGKIENHKISNVWRTIFGVLLTFVLGAGVHPVFAALGVSVTIKPGEPTAIHPGQTTVLRVTLSNSNGSAPITGTSFNNALPGLLPDGLFVNGAVDYTCADPSGAVFVPAGSVTAAHGTQNIALSGGTIPARANSTDGTCTIDIPVTAGSSDGSSATYIYNILSGAVTGNDGAAVSNIGDVSQSINVNSMVRPTISKVFGAGTIILGQNPTPLTITLRNTNALPINGFSITDAFPQLGGSAIIRVANPPNAVATCNNGEVAPVFLPSAGDTTISATGTLPARVGGSDGVCELTVNVEAAHTNGNYSATATNRIDRQVDFTNGLGIRAENDATRDITVRSPLRVEKSFSANQLAAGESGSVTIMFRNDGFVPLTITSFDDNPIDGVGNPDPARGLQVTGHSTTCAGGVTSTLQTSGIDRGVRLNGGIVPASGSCTVTVNFIAQTLIDNTPVTYTNALVAGAVGFVDAAVVSQPVSASILVADTLRVLKGNLTAAPRPGEPVRYSVTVQNWSDAPMNNVRVLDTLTNGMTFLNGTIGAVDYSPTVSAGCGVLNTTNVTGNTSLAFTIPTVPARNTATAPGQCTIEFHAMVPPGAPAGFNTSNVIDAGDVCTDNGGGICNGEGASSINRPVETSVLWSGKRFTPSGPLPEGSVTRMRITLENFSANPLTALSISDTLPVGDSGSQMQVANPANAATSCGGVITAVPGQTSVSLNGGIMPARADAGSGSPGSCFVEVDVVGAAGNYNNIATSGANRLLADGNAVTVTSSASAPFSYTSSLSASKSFTPGAISSGGRSTVRITLGNSGAAALTGVALTDPLPAGMQVATPANAYTTCAGATAVSANPGDNSASLSGAAIAGNGNCDLVFDVTASGAASWINTIPAGNITANGGIRNTGPVSATLTRNAPENLIVAKTTNPSTLTFPGQVSQLTIQITNGSQAVSNLALTDHFTTDGTAGGALNGMVIASSPAAATTCPGGVIHVTPGGTAVSVSGVSLTPAQNCEVTVNVTSTSVGGINNIIPVGAIVSDQGLTNGNEARTSLTTQSNIGVSKQFTPNVVKPGERSRLTITLYNPTAQPATDISLTDNLPAGVVVPAGANASTTCMGGVVSTPVNSQVQISGASLPAAAAGVATSCHAEIDVLVSAEGDYINTIPAGAISGTIGGVPVTNSQPTSDVLRAKMPLQVQKALDALTLDAAIQAGSGFVTGSASAMPGQPRTLTIRLRNPNAVALTGVGVTDALPTGLVVAPTPNAATSCASGVVFADPSATSLRLAGAIVPANGACTVTVDVLSNISGSYVNQIPALAVSSNEGVSNEEPTSAQIVVSTPPAVAKQFDPAVIPAGGVSRLTIFLENTNATAAVLSSEFVDTLPIAPGNIRVAPSPNMLTTCPGAVTANANAADVRYASGAQIPTGGCTISVDVTGSVAGEHLNVIPAAALRTNFGNNPDPAVAPLTISTQGFISGRVFLDNNPTPNGIFEPAIDSGLPGVQIELRSGVNCSAPLVNTATTDALGNYLFTGLLAGSYSVCQPVQPAGTLNAQTTSGLIVSNSGSSGSVGTASNPTPTSSQIVGIVLNGDGAGGEVSGSSGNNFAEIAPSSIQGVVFLDHNNNGVQNGADPGIDGVQLNLAGTDHLGSPVSLTTTTGPDGGYSFDGLRPGTYTVTQPVQPPATANGITTAGAVENGGSAGSVTPVATLPSVIGNIVLPPNTITTGNNFAEIPMGRSLSGTVFLDYDDNGLLDGVDHGISGATIMLTGSDINGNPVSRSTATAADGSYTFADLPEGTYTVDQPAQPDGTSNGTTTAGSTGGTASNPTATSSRIASVDLTGGNSISALNNFAERPGPAPDLTITKTHSPSSFGEGGITGFYTITVSNLSPVAATNARVTVVDDVPAGIVPFEAFGSGWTCSITGQVMNCFTDEVIGASASASPITLRVSVNTGLAGQILVNTAVVSGGGEPPGFQGNNTATDPTPISASANLSGSVWRDLSHDRVRDPGEPGLRDWRVELVLGNTVVATAVTDADGQYAINGVAPGSGYQLRFVEPSTGQVFGSAVPNERGLPATSNVRDDPSAPVDGTNAGNPAGAQLGDGTLRNLSLYAGDNIIEQSLPLDPAGVVYDSVTRQPIQGAVVTLSGPGGFDPALHLVGGSASVVTGADGYYQFLLTPAAPVGDYSLSITTYPAGYMPQPSTIIPACVNTLSVGALPDPALVQAANTAPLAAAALHDPNTCPAASAGLTPVNQASTQYFMTFNLNALTSADVVNNHIPLDPVLGGAIRIVKTTPLVTVSKGEPVPYTITATNTLAAALNNVDVVDQLPPGFRYRSGSASVRHGGAAVFVPAEPAVNGRQLNWPNHTFAPGEEKTFRLVLMVGAGVGEGEYTNLAWALNNVVNERISNIGEATVRIIPDPLFDCSDIIGKVFDDRNANGYQDDGESGIPNVRVVTARGLLVTTDGEGRFHVRCADIPQRDRGSNFVMKLDERTLPSGYRVTTENPRDVRTTRGKMVKLNFGASIHKVFRIEVDSRAFDAEDRLLPEWLEQAKAVMPQMRAQPSVARLAYVADASADTKRVDRRLKQLERDLLKLYREPSDEEDGKLPPLIVEMEKMGRVHDAQGRGE